MGGNGLGRLGRELGVFAAFVGAAVAFTYPLVTDPRRLVTDLADPLLNAWALAWVLHALPADPLHLFDANIFYPETGTLAFSEHLLGVALTIAPLYGLRPEPVLAHNGALLVAIAASGYGAFRLARRLTGSALAGLASGSFFAFAPYRLGHLSHVQLQATAFVPLLYESLGRYAEEGRRRDAAGVGLFLWWTTASCGYYGLFSWILLAAAIPYELARAGRLADGRRWRGLALALAVSAAASLPLAAPYLRLARDFGFARPLERVERAAARPESYLRSAVPWHHRLGLRPAGAERSLFPGVAVLLFAALGLARPDRRRGLYLLVGALAFWASLGPAAGLYAVLYELVPGVRGLRVPARFGIYVVFATAILAGFGVARLLARLGPKARTAFGLLVAALPLAEVSGRTVAFVPAPIAPPAIYDRVAASPWPSPLVELPMPRARARWHENARSMLWSTAHWQPIANGYSAFVPPSYDAIAALAEALPAPAALDGLARWGIRWIVLHRDGYLRPRAEALESALDASPGLRRAAEDGDHLLYELAFSARPPVRENRGENE